MATGALLPALGLTMTTAKLEKWPVTPAKRTVVGVSVLPSGSGLPSASRRTIVMWVASAGWPGAAMANALAASHAEGSSGVFVRLMGFRAIINPKIANPTKNAASLINAISEPF